MVPEAPCSSLGRWAVSGQRAAGAVDFAQQVGHETGSGRRYPFGLRAGWILAAMLESSLTGATRAIDVTDSDEHEH